MTATMQQATDDLLALVKAAWDQADEEYPMMWPDIPEELPTDPKVSWGRTSIQHNLGQQASLANDEGKIRWRRYGILTTQIFTPMGTGSTKKYELAELLEDGLRGKSTPHGVWLRNVSVNEVGQSGAYFQTNVLAQFEYDKVK